MMGDIPVPLLKLGRRRKVPEEKKIRCFQVRGFGAQRLDSNPTILKNPTLAVHIADRRRGGWNAR
jgi:hypothetical protein